MTRSAADEFEALRGGVQMALEALTWRKDYAETERLLRAVEEQMAAYAKHRERERMGKL